MEKLLHYKDIALADPVYSEVRSRDDISSDVEFLGRKFKSVAIPANMKATISFEKAEELAQNGYFYILHRFYNYPDILDWIAKMCNKDGQFISISVGVKEKDRKLIDDISEMGFWVDYITIDIAFGHSILMKEMIAYIKNKLPNTKIIAGNVCTANAVRDLVDWGASACKIGIAGGSGCRTYNATGIKSPMFSTMLKCFDWKSKIPLIADGGAKEPQDACKALVAGATMVMYGGSFCACIDSPAETIYKEEEIVTQITRSYNKYSVIKTPTHKIYFGSASAKNKGEDKYTEGAEEVLLKVNPKTYLEYFETINQGIRSCMSYHNLRDIKDMNKIKWSIHNP